MCQILIFFLVVKLSFAFGGEALGYEQHQIHDEPKKYNIIPILKSNYEQGHDQYQYSYETGNGIHAQETGFIKNKGDKKHETLVQQGSITYHDEHGNPITLTYIADENGFQPQGDHLPTSPPIPEAIQKTLHEISHQQEYVKSEEAVPQYGALQYH